MSDMAEKKLWIKQLKPDLYLLDEDHNATGYLVIGSERACLIDTMNGVTDIGAAVSGLTDKPLVIVNTHGHWDHVGGNVYFEEAFMHPADLPLAYSFFESEKCREFCKKLGRSMPPFKDIQQGDQIDLGGKTLVVYDHPGHTAGGILLLLKEDRILFTGDSVNHHLWIMLDGCMPLEDYVRVLDKNMFLEKEADVILHGHASGFDDISLMRALRGGIQEILEGKTQDDQPYDWFGGTARQHAFKVAEGKEYERPDSVIVYPPRYYGQQIR